MGRHKLPKPEEMSAVYEDWQKALPLEEDKPENTVRAYGQALRRVVLFAELEPGEFSPECISQAVLTNTVRQMRAKGASKATVNQTLAAVGSFFDWCIAHQVIAEGPDIHRIRKISKLDPGEADPDYYRQEELIDLLETAGSRSTNKRIRWPERFESTS